MVLCIQPHSIHSRFRVIPPLLIINLFIADTSQINPKLIIKRCATEAPRPRMTAGPGGLWDLGRVTLWLSCIINVIGECTLQLWDFKWCGMLTFFVEIKLSASLVLSLLSHDRGLRAAWKLRHHSWLAHTKLTGAVKILSWPLSPSLVETLTDIHIIQYHYICGKLKPFAADNNTN